MRSASPRPDMPLPKPPKMSPLNANCFHAALALLMSVPVQVSYAEPSDGLTPL